MADGGWSLNELCFTKAACSTQTVFPFLQTLFIALASYSSLNDLAWEQALLFGREKRVSRERGASSEATIGVLARLTSLAQIGELARRL